MPRDVLREFLSEELSRSVPEFVFREEFSKFVEAIGKQLKKHVLQTQKDPKSQREAFETMQASLDDLEDEANELVASRLWDFVQKI